MCFVVRNPQGQIKLYCKGADTIIFDRLDPSCEVLVHTTSEHLSVSLIQLESGALYILYTCTVHLFMFLCRNLLEKGFVH